MRGVAALAVVVFHVGRWIHEAWFPHGYLAVDFFFCLSGFVMAHAYEDKLSSRMGLGDFTAKRLIRLWPLIALSMGLGAAFGLAKVVTGAPGADSLSGILMALVLGLLVTPMAWNGHDSYQDRLFPLNGPAWSLFLELFANIVWAAAARWLSTKTLVIVAVVSGLGMTGGGYYFGSLDFGSDTASFWLGFTRVFFSFTLGLLAYRAYASGRFWFRLPIWGLAPILLLIFAAPIFELQWIFELVVVGLVFPLVVLAGARLPEPSGLAGPVWRLSGEVSYPLYVLHAPLWFLFSRSFESFQIDISTPLGLAYVGFATIASWLALKLYDEPTRAWASRKRRQGWSILKKSAARS